MESKEFNLESEEDSNDEEGKKSESEAGCDIYQDLDEASSDLPVIKNDGKEILDTSHDAGSEDDIDLYDDLDVVDKQIAAQELEIKVKYLEDRCSKADQKNEELTLKLTTVNKQNFALRKNISSLMKTARMESARKDREIKDLQRKYDEIVFRRGSAKLPRNHHPTVTGSSGSVGGNVHSDGKTTVLPEGTEYSFQMGNVSVCFSMEHENFKHKRQERLEDFANGMVTPNELTEEIPKTSGENLEDGEVDDQNTENTEPGGNKVSAPESHSHSRRRRSRSPINGNKRKRSISPDDRRHRTKPRQKSPPRRSENEDRSNRWRSCRSPKKYESFDRSREPSRSRSSHSHYSSRFKY